MPVGVPTNSQPEAGRLGEHLRTLGLTIAVAESCTGGLLGAAITAEAGSSDYFRGGVIAYSNEVKTGLLGVAPDLLRQHGAVSEVVAVAMAEGVRRVCSAGIGVGITGIAGPAADGSAKPVGLMFVAVVDVAGTEVVRLEADGDRNGNRALAVEAAIAAVLRRGKDLPSL